MNFLKRLVVNKAYLEKYYSEEWFEKAMGSHKYIRRIPKASGKGYNYIYPKDFSKPLKVLLSIFGMKEEKVDDTYEKNNIKENYGVDKKGFAAHLLEYLSNRATWNKFFGDKFNRDRFKNPQKTEIKKVEGSEEKKITNTKQAEKKNTKAEGTEKNFKTKWNNSLMRKIYSMYNPIPEDKKESVNEITQGLKLDQVVKTKDGIGKISGYITKDRKVIGYKVRIGDKSVEAMIGDSVENKTNESVAVEADVNGAVQEHKGTENEPEEASKNRSEAMMGNQNAKKDSIKQKFKFEHSDYSLEDLKKLRVDIQYNINMLADDEYALPEDKENLTANLEAIDEMIALLDSENVNENTAAETKPEIKDFGTGKFVVETVQMDGSIVRNHFETKDKAIKSAKNVAGLLNNVRMYDEGTDEVYFDSNDLSKKTTDYLKARKLEVQSLLNQSSLTDYAKDQYNKELNNINNELVKRGETEAEVQGKYSKATKLGKIESKLLERDITPEDLQNIENIVVRELNKKDRLITSNIYDDIDSYIGAEYPDLEAKILHRTNQNGAAVWNENGFNSFNDVKEYIKGFVEYYKKNNQTLSEAMKGNQNAAGKHNVKPQTTSEMKKEKEEEKKSRKKAGLKVPDEKLGERSSAIEDVDYQNHEFNETEDNVKETLQKEVKAPSNQVQKDAFNALAKARYELRKKEFGASFYGKNNHILSATDEDVAEAQKKYDEALAKYNELMNGDITNFSYDPNAQNYAFRDTGYIAGSQKEKIAQFWADVEQRGGGVKVEDIDWEALEQNLRYAETKIIKANILRKPDFESLRDNGMTGGAAYFYNRVLDCIPGKPAENTPECHRQYVLAINTFQERLESCKTVKEMVKELSDISDELYGHFVGIEQTPEVVKILAQIDALKSKQNEEIKAMSEAKQELWNIPEVKEFAEKNNDYIRQAYGKPFPFAMGGRNESKDSKLRTNFTFFWDSNDKWYTFIKDNEKTLSKHPEFKTYKALLDKCELKERKGYYQNINVQYPSTIKINELDKQKADFIKGKNAEFSENSEEHKMWLSFGPVYDAKNKKSRFADYVSSAADFGNFFYRGNKTILEHFQNAMRGKFDDWEWLPKKEENSVSGEKKERKESFQLLVATEHERKGGKDVSVKTTQELKKMFNLRDIQSGEWVLQDPKSAKWHVDRCCESFSDLCDLTGIPENMVSLNGRLALAIGARGHKGALAHYEPIERVINITKMHGGGSLAHEWFHSFDNLLSEAMLGGNIDAWLTKPGTLGHKDAPDSVIPEVKAAFTKLVDAMTKGDIPVFEPVKVTDADRKNYNKTLKENLIYRTFSFGTDGLYGKIMQAKDFNEANKVLLDNFKSLVYKHSDGSYSEKSMARFIKCQKAVAAKFGKDTVDVFTGKTASSYYVESKKLDGGKRKYWSTTHEMAARAFSGFIGDSLRNAGRVNTYLTSHDTNDAYRMYGVKPNPEGEERERINQAFKELFAAVKATNAIRKAIDIVDNFIQKSVKPRFIIKGGRFLIRK